MHTNRITDAANGFLLVVKEHLVKPEIVIHATTDLLRRRRKVESDGAILFFFGCAVCADEIHASMYTTLVFLCYHCRVVAPNTERVKIRISLCTFYSDSSRV